MFAGFDYGTSNCAISVINNNQAQLVNLGEHGKYMPSSLFAPRREMLSAWLDKQLQLKGVGPAFTTARKTQLPMSRRFFNELKLDGYDTEVLFGEQALAEYLDESDDCYYIKSPKSFLGASGLQAPQIQSFEDMVAAMMLEVKSQAEHTLGQSIEQVVIGKPVNFQGANADNANTQALTILTNAAKYVGFKQVEFQFEPMAAGLSFEAQLQQSEKVLVVDIGGGTSDVSMVLMGPQFHHLADRQQQILGHSGVRVGGNDFDIHHALHNFMPEFGLNDTLKNGLPMPQKPFWDGVSINDFPAQSRFYSKDTALNLKDTLEDANQPQKLARLLKLANMRQTHQLVYGAEMSKRQLSEAQQVTSSLDFVDEGLQLTHTSSEFENANKANLEAIGQLIDEALMQAGSEPDTVFVTGGSAKSPTIKNFIANKLNKPVVSGDDFGSVANGLGLWAQRVFS
ncbi:molecular chaperone [Paraferrimonas sp. SM1919]|uniref:molecular chaperone n=1 Tax=Paraferrimonas sp. SM1919 TaxID=2662263 RepID=UPI0013D45795|nr:molecular chaperone [Paraferrimonas sp. SM1919]